MIEKRITLTPGGKELVATMRAKGYYTALVSGGFTVFTTRVADMIGFQENRANILVSRTDNWTAPWPNPFSASRPRSTP